jgi:hypothetical protein
LGRGLDAQAIPAAASNGALGGIEIFGINGEL